MGSSVASLVAPRRVTSPRFAPTRPAAAWSATADFALIGHQESWRAAADVLAVLRGSKHAPLPDSEIKDNLPWIPPRTVCHVEARSLLGLEARGLYIDSFIPPDRLEAAHIHDNTAPLRLAAACRRLQAIHDELMKK